MARRWMGVGVLALWMSVSPLTPARETVPAKDAKPVAAEKIVVSEVILQGNQRMTTEQIKIRLRTQAGKEYHPSLVDEDVRELYKTNQFSNIRTLVQEDGPNRAKIFFLFLDMPNRIQKVTLELNPPQTHNRPDDKPGEQSLARIGQILVSGNQRISSESIRAHVPLVPGQVLTYRDLRQAEKILAKLGLFVVDPATGVHPTITVVEVESDSTLKNLLITVREK